MSRRVASLVTRLRWAVVVVWAVATVLSVAFLPTIREAQTGALGDLVPVDAEAISAEARSAELFAFPTISRTQVVLRDRDGLEAALVTAAARRVLQLNRKEIPGLRAIGGAYAVANIAGSDRFSPERGTTLVLPLLFTSDIGPRERTELAEGLIVRLRPMLGEASAGVTGVIAAREEQSRLIEERLPLVELVTLLVVLLTVAVSTRSVVAPVVTVVAVGIAYVVSIRVAAALGEVLGVSVPSEVEPVVVALLFGVVTDYALFFFSRFRVHLRERPDGHSAARTASAELAPILTACGLAVALGCAALLAARLGFLRAFGPGVAVSVLVALVVSLTLVPAAAAILGRALLWPRGMAHEERTGPGPERRIRRIVAHPRLAATAALMVLAAMASGTLWLELGNPLIRGLPADASPRQAYEQTSAGLAPGVISPVVVVVEGRGITAQRRGLSQLQQVLDDQPGVAAVVGPDSNPTARVLGAVLSRSGNAARYVVLLSDDPLGGPAVRRLTNLRQRLPGLLDLVGLRGGRVSVAGDTALVAETIAEAEDDLPRVLPVVLLAVTLVLAALLRALVAPVVLALLALLAPAAATGLAVLVFQGLLGHEELTYFVPIAAGVLLVALGSDYNVFLAGRVWAEACRRSFAEAVVVGGAGAANAISAAAIVLAASFAAIALVPVRAFHELAFIVAVGLLLDAFIVRSVLVPAVLTMLGDRAVWPGPRTGRDVAPPVD